MIGRYSWGSRGDTIIEVLIAITIVSAILGGAYVSASRSINGSRQSEERGEALKIAEAQLEYLRALSADPAIYAAGTFCIDDSGNYQSPATPAVCNKVLGGVTYQRSITHASNLFTVQITWDRAGGGGTDALKTEELKLAYRLYQP
jgi:prepilin-type N-terminal cleavage/methylation domain-containing protein